MTILLVQIIVEFYHKEGVNIFVYNKLKYNTINLEEFTTEKDIEVCAIYLSINSLCKKNCAY
jgi:hypothetical protein